jgi:hypothetical protein
MLFMETGRRYESLQGSAEKRSSVHQSHSRIRLDFSGSYASLASGGQAIWNPGFKQGPAAT